MHNTGNNKKLCSLFLSQFPHFTPLVLHSFMAKISSRLLIRKFVGNVPRFPFSGTLNSGLHSGHAITFELALVRWIPFRQWNQKLCKQGNCFGSVKLHIHTEQENSSWRLSSKVLISMSNCRKQRKKSSHMKSPDQVGLVCDINCNKLMTSTNDEVLFWHVLTVTTFWEWLQNNSRFLRIMLTKRWLQKLLDKTRKISHKVSQNRIEDRAALLCPIYVLSCLLLFLYLKLLKQYPRCQRLELIVRGEAMHARFISL